MPRFRPTPRLQWPFLLLALAACPDGKAPQQPGTGTGTGGSKQLKRQLSSLPYVNWVPVKKKDRGLSGVTRHNPDRAYRGLNLYCSLPRARARLVDMFGRQVHSWASQAGQPSPPELEWRRTWSHLDFIGWQHVKMTRSGELFVVVYLYGLLKLDWDSRVLWVAPFGAHHDIDVADNGEIYTLAAEKRQVRHQGRKLRILDDLVLILGPDGKQRRRISMLKVLRADPRTAPLLKKKLDWAAPHFANNFAAQALLAQALIKDKRRLQLTAAAYQQILTDRFAGTKRIERMLMISMLPMDPLHVNSLEILRRDVEGLGRKGDLLLSVRELDLVLVMDPRQAKIRWTFGPDVLQRQHQPSLLDSNRLLIFDNGTFARRSRVVELDPASSKIVWSYQAKDFFSPIRGGCQRLPNGNTLIVESERGRALEVAPDGALVWEFFNPDTKDPFMGRERAPIYRMTRLAPEFLARPTSAPTRLNR